MCGSVSGFERLLLKEVSEWLRCVFLIGDSESVRSGVGELCLGVCA